MMPDYTHDVPEGADVLDAIDKLKASGYSASIAMGKLVVSCGTHDLAEVAKVIHSAKRTQVAAVAEAPKITEATPAPTAPVAPVVPPTAPTAPVAPPTAPPKADG